MARQDVTNRQRAATSWEPDSIEVDDEGIVIVAADETTLSVLMTNHGGSTVFLANTIDAAVAAAGDETGPRIDPGGFVSVDCEDQFAGATASGTTEVSVLRTAM